MTAWARPSRAARRAWRSPAPIRRCSPTKIRTRWAARIAPSPAAYRPALELITRHEINWTIVASATPAWAAAMFPDDPPDAAMAKLWDAIFETTRINADDPVAAWKAHDAGSAEAGGAFE